MHFWKITRTVVKKKCNGERSHLPMVFCTQWHRHVLWDCSELGKCCERVKAGTLNPKANFPTKEASSLRLESLVRWQGGHCRADGGEHRCEGRVRGPTVLGKQGLPHSRPSPRCRGNHDSHESINKESRKDDQIPLTKNNSLFPQSTIMFKNHIPGSPGFQATSQNHMGCGPTAGGCPRTGGLAPFWS